MFIAIRHNKVIHYCESGYISVGTTLICEAEKLAFDSASFVEVESIPNDIEVYDYFYVEGKFIKEDKKILKNEIITSERAEYSEVREWSDYNPNNEQRVGYFVCFDSNASNPSLVKKASREDDIRGVTVSSPAFAINSSFDKYLIGGKLNNKYCYVATLGIVDVLDDGSCIPKGRCMPNNNGIATNVNTEHGYFVLERIDQNHIKILVEPGVDCLYKLELSKVSCSIPMHMSINEKGGLRITYDDGQ